MKSLVLAAVAAVVLVAPAAAQTRPFDPRVYQDRHVGEPTQILVLGTPHLSGTPETFDPSVLEPLLLAVLIAETSSEVLPAAIFTVQAGKSGGSGVAVGVPMTGGKGVGVAVADTKGPFLNLATVDAVLLNVRALLACALPMGLSPRVRVVLEK